MKLYHATTEKMAKRYRETGAIKAPVRGFATLMAAMAWAVKVGRKVIYEIEITDEAADIICHKLPDHHNAYGDAWWIDCDVQVEKIKCVFSAEKDA